LKTEVERRIHKGFFSFCCKMNVENVEQRKKRDRHTKKLKIVDRRDGTSDGKFYYGFELSKMANVYVGVE